MTSRPRLPLPRAAAGRPARRLLAALALGALALAGCIDHPYVWVSDLPRTTEGPGVIGPRDTVLVTVRNQPALSGEFVVRDDGAYLQPTLGNTPVAGKTPDAVAIELATRLNGIVVSPDVTVAILKTAPIRVDVVGEVKTPGAYELTRDRGVIAALASAGWLTDFARRDRIFVVRSDRRIRFHANALTSAEGHAAAFRLHDGDVVVVE